MIFIIRSGVQILVRPSAAVLDPAQHAGQGLVPDPEAGAGRSACGRPSRTRSACRGQVGLPGLRHSIGLARWWHLGVDVLWLLNGVVFYVLLFATGQWRRLVPTSWERVSQRRCRC